MDLRLFLHYIIRTKNISRQIFSDKSDMRITGNILVLFRNLKLKIFRTAYSPSIRKIHVKSTFSTAILMTMASTNRRVPNEDSDPLSVRASFSTNLVIPSTLGGSLASNADRPLASTAANRDARTTATESNYAWRPTPSNDWHSCSLPLVKPGAIVSKKARNSPSARSRSLDSS